MALILALNPGNSHSPTLSRLARELHGCELIGAESCVVAINAIKKRVPDVVLLPARPARGEADLIAHLKSVPGGVLTLEAAACRIRRPGRSRKTDSRDADGGACRPPTQACRASAAASPNAKRLSGTSPHLLAAATAADHLDSRATRTMGRGAARRYLSRACRRNGPACPEPLNPTSLRTDRADRRLRTLRADRTPTNPKPNDPDATAGSQGRALASTQHQSVAAARGRAWRSSSASLAALVSYWPQIRGGSRQHGRAKPAHEARFHQPADVNPKPVVPQPAREARDRTRWRTCPVGSRCSRRSRSSISEGNQAGPRSTNEGARCWRPESTGCAFRIASSGMTRRARWK